MVQSTVARYMVTRPRPQQSSKTQFLNRRFYGTKMKPSYAALSVVSRLSSNTQSKGRLASIVRLVRTTLAPKRGAQAVQAHAYFGYSKQHCKARKKQASNHACDNIHRSHVVMTFVEDLILDSAARTQQRRDKVKNDRIRQTIDMVLGQLTDHVVRHYFRADLQRWNL